MKKLLLVPLLLAVAACGVKPRVEFPTPPADKLVCPDEPGVPDDPITDEKNATYLKSLRAAGQGCRADVDWLRVWFKTLNAR